MPDARRNRYEVYRATDGWRWRLVAAENGETLASGEAYADRRDCEKAVARMQDDTIPTTTTTTTAG